MWVDIYTQIGIDGTKNKINNIFLSPCIIGKTSNWAGSYHIRNMGRQYSHYSNNNFQLPLLGEKTVVFPNSIMQLKTKERDSNITGNIGECLAALVSRNYLNLSIKDIAHIKRSKGKGKCPDYLLRLNRNSFNYFNLPSNSTALQITHWPAESKARKNGNNIKDAVNNSLLQLISYWSVIANNNPSCFRIGYGLIFTYCIDEDAITITLLEPINLTQSQRSDFIESINSISVKSGTDVKKEDTDIVKGFLV